MLEILEFITNPKAVAALFAIAMAFKVWYSDLGYTTYMQDDYPWVVPKINGVDQPQSAFPIVWDLPFTNHLGTYSFIEPPSHIMSEVEDEFGEEGVDWRASTVGFDIYDVYTNGAFANRFSNGFNVGEQEI